MGFDALIDDLLASEFEDSPTRATALGVDGYDDLLGDHTETAYRQRVERASGWLDRFSALPDADLTADELIDRDLVCSTMRGRLVMADFEDWRRNPSTYLGPGLSGVFSLFLHRLHPSDELASSAAARLRAVPEVLTAGKANLSADLSPPIFVERAKGQCQAAIAYARSLVPQEAASDEERELLTEAGEVAATAYEDFAGFLDDLGKDASGSYAIGEERYSGLLRDKEQLGYGAREMLERGRKVFASLEQEIAALAASIGGDRPWVETVRELSQRHPATPEAMRDAYGEWTERARSFLRDRRLVTLPEGETCHVVPSPPFQRPVLAVASYNPPPAFRPTRTGYFFVPYPPEGTSEEEVAKRLESNSELDIPTTAVHEAYPGHHWHFAALQDNPRPIRKVFGTSYFVEGWALYTELMMREQGFFTDPVHELGMLNARIFRAARIVVDTSLHLEEMDFESAVGFMQGVGLSEPTARAEVGRYCTWPTQAPSYLTGSLEIERMRDRYLAEHPGELRAFHDSLATSGMLPIGLAERALFGP